MLRTVLRSLALPTCAAWLVLAAMERPMSVACQMVGTGDAMSAGHVMAGAPGMRHRAHQVPGGTTVPSCCGCLGDCGTAPVATIPGGGSIVAVLLSPRVVHVADLLHLPALVTRTDLALPYPNAPPLSALIS